MLQKFKVIEEIGRFAKLTHKAEPLTRLSLIFGRNGYGKSTICAILRSLGDGANHHITARRKLGAVADSRVESVWASGATIAYSVGKWNGCPGPVFIFDQEYVSRNLHVGDSVTRDNKRSLLPVVLGAEGVALAEKVVCLDKEQRDVDQDRRDQVRIIVARCKGLLPDDVSKFCTAVVPADLSTRIAKAAQRVELAKQAAVVKQKKNPPPLDLGDLANAADVLSETLEGVSEHAAKLVLQHLAAHPLGERGQGWLEYGTAHAPKEVCPYCAQGTAGLPLVLAYQAYFSDAFKALKARVDELWRVVDDLSAGKFGEVIASNHGDLTYWAKLCSLPSSPTLSTAEQASTLAALLSLREILDKKRQNVLEGISLGDKEEEIRSAFALLVTYNESMAACCAVIDQARADTAESDIKQAEDNHAKWLALAEKASEPVSSAVLAYISAEKRLEEIKVEKAAAQKALTNYTATTMATRQSAVNDLLSDFGAAFRVVDAKTNFVGREPNTEFAIEIGTFKVKAGDKSDTEPSFKTVLSAGDKNTLALAFFIAQIKADSGLKDAVVVFDDPFNSQDMDRQFQTTSHIRAVSTESCQTIVLSHDPRFLQLIEKNADSSVTRTFQLQCSDAGEGSLQKWSSADELKSLYVQQSEMIREYATHQKILGGQSLNTIKQAIRPFLEDYLRLRFPGRFPDQAHIFEMANTVKEAGQQDPLINSVADLFALNEYTRPNMHGGGETPVAGELRTHCRKVVAIVGSY